MRSFYENDIRKRTLVLSLFFVAWFLLISMRLVQLQVFAHNAYREAVDKQNQNERSITPERGSLYDRNGTLLACSLPVPSIFLRPVAGETETQEKDKVRKLQSVLNLSTRAVSDILRRLRESGDNEDVFIYVKRKVPDDVAARVRTLNLANVFFEEERKRFYPKTTLAAHLLGGVNIDGRGISGVEEHFDDYLRGEPGRKLSYYDSHRRKYQDEIIKSPVPGKDLYLTIDETIQFIAEKAIGQAVEEQNAEWGTVILCDPSSGEILAMANYPSFDPNVSPGDLSVLKNKAIQFNYEPGSTFKIVTAAAARENQVVGYSDVFDVRSGSIRVAGTSIRDHKRMGLLSFPEVLIESSNVGAAMFAMRLTPADFYETIKRFRFGEKTGIELAEEAGRIRHHENWPSAASLPHIAIGYEIMATPLQVLMAMNVYATNGIWLKPRIIGAPVKTEEIADQESSERVQILDAAIAGDLSRRVFRGVVEQGTGKAAKLDGYSIAGKTGTAKIYDASLRRYTQDYTASFVGFTPIENPALTMIVVIYKPQKAIYGGDVAAPVFRDIARQVLRYLQIPSTETLSVQTLAPDSQNEERP